MDAKQAQSAFKITEELHKDIDAIYEAVVDEDSNTSSLIDGMVAKLKSLKSNLSKTDEV